MSWKPLHEHTPSPEEIEEEKIKELLSLAMTEEGQTIVHCQYRSKEKYVNGGWINIWKETYLYNKQSGSMLKMTHAIDVPIAPAKYYFKRAGDSKNFTLIFPRIPSNWDKFSLIEITDVLSPSFTVRNIERNDSGVYHVNIY